MPSLPIVVSIPNRTCNPAFVISLDDDRNSAGAPIICQGRCEVHVMPTDEERMIARHARRLVPSSVSHT